MTQALAVGVMIPEMQYHAGIIARDAGDTDAAKSFFEKAKARTINTGLKKHVEEAQGSLK